MKKLILIVTVLMASISFAAGNPSLKNEIVNKMNPNLSEIELDEFHQDFVVVSFSIKDGKIHVLDMQGSKEELIQAVLNELSEMHILKAYSDSDIYNYKFTFKKG